MCQEKSSSILTLEKHKSGSQRLTAGFMPPPCPLLWGTPALAAAMMDKESVHRPLPSIRIISRVTHILLGYWNFHDLCRIVHNSRENFAKLLIPNKS